jgi:hypothetical protein
MNSHSGEASDIHWHLRSFNSKQKVIFEAKDAFNLNFLMVTVRRQWQKTSFDSQPNLYDDVLRDFLTNMRFKNRLEHLFSRSEIFIDGVRTCESTNNMLNQKRSWKIRRSPWTSTVMGFESELLEPLKPIPRLNILWSFRSETFKTRSK